MNTFAKFIRILPLCLLLPLTINAQKTYSFCNDSLCYITTGVNTVAFAGDQPCFSVVIPSTATSNANTYSVTSIAKEALRQNVCIRSITIPSTVQHIGVSAFDRDSNLSTVTFDGSYSKLTIDTFAFMNCISLKNITLPVGTDSLRYCTFRQCTSLQQVTIPASVRSVGAETFALCNALTDIYVSWNATELAALDTGINIFQNLTRRNIKLHVPCEYVSTYQTIAPWRDLNIVTDETPAAVVTPPAANTLTYNGSAQALVTAGTASGGSLQYRLGTSGEWTATIPTATDAGAYNVYYKVDAEGCHTDYTPEEPIAVTISKAALTITAENKTITYGDAAPSYTASYSGWQGSDDASVLSSLTFTCDYTQGNNAGTYTITPSASAANYAITTQSGTLTVNKADVALTPPIGKTLMYNGTAQNLITAGVATGGTLHYKLQDGEYSTTLPSATNVGSYTVHYKVDGDANHNDIAEASLTSTISMQITVRPVVGADYLLTDVAQDNTTLAIKTRLASLTGLAVGEMFLHFGSNLMEDSRTLEKYGIISGSILYLTERRIFSDMAEDNETRLAALIGTGPHNILISRMLYKDGYFNTLCLPVAISDLENSPLAGCELYAFESANNTGSGLELYLTQVHQLEAGQPYLIRWLVVGENITGLAFDDVDIICSTGQALGTGVQFVGSIGRTQLTIDNTDHLFVGDNNKLYWPNTNNKLKAFRAYFLVSGEVAPHGTPARVVIRRTPTETEAIESHVSEAQSTKQWRNGQLIIIRNGVEYNAQGQIIKQ